MGQPAADTLAEAPPRFDRTHLGPKGAAYFADMVVGEMKTAVPVSAGLFIAPRP